MSLIVLLLLLLVRGPVSCWCPATGVWGQGWAASFAGIVAAVGVAVDLGGIGLCVRFPDVVHRDEV